MMAGVHDAAHERPWTASGTVPQKARSAITRLALLQTTDRVGAIDRPHARRWGSGRRSTPTSSDGSSPTPEIFDAREPGWASVPREASSSAGAFQPAKSTSTRWRSSQVGCSATSPAAVLLASCCRLCASVRDLPRGSGRPARLARAGRDAVDGRDDPGRVRAGPGPWPSSSAIISTAFSRDLGRSLRTRETVAADLARYFPNTSSWSRARCFWPSPRVPLGILSAVYRDTWVDQLTRSSRSPASRSRRSGSGSCSSCSWRSSWHPAARWRLAS